MIYVEAVTRIELVNSGFADRQPIIATYFIYFLALQFYILRILM
jgi:hypothetical protein